MPTEVGSVCSVHGVKCLNTHPFSFTHVQCSGGGMNAAEGVLHIATAWAEESGCHCRSGNVASRL